MKKFTVLARDFSEAGGELGKKNFIVNTYLVPIYLEKICTGCEHLAGFAIAMMAVACQLT